jgi:hypothetical protein
VGDRASQAAGFTDDDDVALVGVRVPMAARALGAVSVFPAEGDGDVARREVAAFTDNEGGGDANVNRRRLTGVAAAVLLMVVVSSLTLAALGAEEEEAMWAVAVEHDCVRRCRWGWRWDGERAAGEVRATAAGRSALYNEAGGSGRQGVALAE